MIICTYIQLKPNQKVFQTKIIDPKLCIKKIKMIDSYYSYIAYADYNYMIDNKYDSGVILAELINKYPKKIEAYLKYWYLLAKGPNKDYKLCHKLSEMFWKNSSMINFDNNVYQ
jgi:hypothetical protein